MLLHSDAFISIIFGDAQEKFVPACYRNYSPLDLLGQQQFADLKHTAQMQSLLFLHQVHGNSGMVVDAENQLTTIKNFSIPGDFLCTNLSAVGIGVVTADCLPIILYDTKHHALSAIHAGWRGSVQGIVPQAIEAMKNSFGTHAKDLRVFFGPSAQVCCYEVKEDIIPIISATGYAEEVICKRNESYFLDVIRLNTHELFKQGIKKSAINYTHSLCTMCTNSFCSYRKQPETEFRQMTVVALKNR